MRSNKTSFFLFAICTALSAIICVTVAFKNTEGIQAKEIRQQNPVATFEGEPDNGLSSIMVPIPMKDRVYNKTGIQCVWASLECIGRYAEEPKLIDLTKDNECKSYSSPSGLAYKLNKIKVKFEQTTSTSDKSLIMKAVVKERRGVLFGIPGHAMVMVHYDEKAVIMKYINNSDKDLAIRTWTINEFNKRWDGWICAIYADKDIIPLKGIASKIRIVDMMNEGFVAPKGYVLLPN